MGADSKLSNPEDLVEVKVMDEREVDSEEQVASVRLLALVPQKVDLLGCWIRQISQWLATSVFSAP